MFKDLYLNVREILKVIYFNKNFFGSEKKIYLILLIKYLCVIVREYNLY